MELRNCEIKSVSIEDFEDYYSIRSEKTNLFWTGYDKAPNIVKFKEWFKNRILEKDKTLYLLICNKKCIGSLNIDFYGDFALIGYSVKESYTGKGIGTFIVDNAIKILMKHKEISLVKAWINFQNISSIKVIEKNKFFRTGVTEIRKRFGNKEEYIEFSLDIRN